MERQSKMKSCFNILKISALFRDKPVTRKRSASICSICKARGLQAERDAHHNVLIRKPSTIPGYKGPTVIVQGHMDIVYERVQIALISTKMVSMLWKKMAI